MYYHLSEIGGLFNLTPRVPAISLDTFEDTSIPRVCFSDSIDGCISALQYASRFFVYVPLGNPKLITPTVEQVRDAQFTHEVWSLEKVPVRCLGRVIATWDYKEEQYVVQIGSIKDVISVLRFPWKWDRKFKYLWPYTDVENNLV